MPFTDKLGRPVACSVVYNRTVEPPFSKPVVIKEDFPFLGIVSIKPGEVKEIPTEIANRWCSPESWSRWYWPVDEDSKVIPPITFSLPVRRETSGADLKDDLPPPAPVRAAPAVEVITPAVADDLGEVAPPVVEVPKIVKPGISVPGRK